MNLKIYAKVAVGYIVIIIGVIINSYINYNALSRSHEVDLEITTIYTPSRELINDLYAKISDSRMLIKSWVHIDKISDTPDKIKLKDLHDTEYPTLSDSLKALSIMWEKQGHQEHKKMLEDIDVAITDSLFESHKEIMTKLGSFEDYENTFVIFEVSPMVEDQGEVMELTERILAKISDLKTAQEEVEGEGMVEKEDRYMSFRKSIFIMFVILLFISLIMALFTINSLTRPINHTKNILLSMSKGILPKEKLKEGSDEVGQMAKALNLVVQTLKDITNFTFQIGKGNFNTEFTPLSEEDVLGQSLIEMREELVKAQQEDEKRKQEDENRNWASQGVALFSDILRKNNDDLDKLSYEIISNMVRYTKSNQGGIFIVNDTDPKSIFIEMTACYAFDRQKFVAKRFEIGEGLIGRCYQEQEKIYLTDIPEDYIRITSGLGDENPSSLLVVPLAYNNKIYGIIELASFKKFDDFEIEFIERIGESIAATISSVKSNIQTQILLEQSQQQAEEMSSQEEEMRQNMEELRATQEQSARREEELQKEVLELKKKMKNLKEA